MKQQLFATLLSVITLHACGQFHQTNANNPDSTPEWSLENFTCPDIPAPHDKTSTNEDSIFASDDDFVFMETLVEAQNNNADFIILDVRPESDYALHHINQALSLPFYQSDACIEALPRDRWIIAYCGCPHHQSLNFVHKLKKLGFTKVKALYEGYIVWREQGHPTASLNKGP